MKTERRHELQENELAHLLVEQSSKAQPYLKIAAGLTILIAAVLVGGSYINSRNRAQQEAAWAAFYEATNTGDPEEFRQVAETYPGTLASGWALESAGDLLLNQGVGQLFQDKEQAAKQMESAKTTYEAVINTFSDEMLVQRATFGLGKAYESMGDLTKAAEVYESISKKWPNAEFSKAATDRLESINRPQSKAWYEWLAEQKPVKNAASDPSVFRDLPNLPDKPDLSMPKPGELLGPSGNPTTTGTPDSSTETPANGNSLLPSGALETPPAATESGLDLPPSDSNTFVPATDAPAADVPAADIPATEVPAAPIELPGPGADVPASGVEGSAPSAP